MGDLAFFAIVLGFGAAPAFFATFAFFGEADLAFLGLAAFFTDFFAGDLAFLALVGFGAAGEVVDAATLAFLAFFGDAAFFLSPEEKKSKDIY